MKWVLVPEDPTEEMLRNVAERYVYHAEGCKSPMEMAYFLCRAMIAAAPKPEEPVSRPYSDIVSPYAAALRMVRESVGELFGPKASIESEDAVLLRGPEPHHEAEAIIASLQRVSSDTTEDELTAALANAIEADLHE